MDLTRADLANATRAVRLLLSDLELEEYLFTVEAGGKESRVRIEYAATDGWRSATLPVDDAALLACRENRQIREALLRQWREKLTHARRRTDPREDLRAEAAALGRAWADEKARALRDRVPVEDWPELWDASDDGPLPVDLPEERRAEMLAVAHREARERWRELLADQRAVESIEEDTHDLEAGAVRLEASLRDAVPPGISAGRDGSRVYLMNADTRMERTVTSLESAARVIDEWTQEGAG